MKTIRALFIFALAIAGAFTALAQVIPLTLAANVNQSVTIQVTVTGTSPFTYLFQKLPPGAPAGTAPTPINPPGVAAPGVIVSTVAPFGASLVMSSVGVKDGGIYSVVVTNAAGSTTTPTATLTVSRLVQAALTITSPATAALGAPYAATFAGGSSSAPAVWALGTGSTAPGAAIDPASGAVTATGPGSVVFTVSKAQDGVYQAATSAPFTLAISPVPPTVTGLSGTVK